MVVITESSPEYCNEAEQLRILGVIESKYGKVHGGDLSVSSFTTKPEFVILELHKTVTVVESVIQADFYDKRKESTGHTDLKIYRKTLEMEVITSEEAKAIRGYWFDERGLIRWV